MKKALSKYTLILLLALPLAFYMSSAYPSSENSSRKTNSTEHAKENTGEVMHGHADPIAPILLSIIIILAAAKIGGGIFEKIGQPAVLGELVLGIIIGNLAYFTGWEFFAQLRNHTFVDLLARFGAIILLFEIGLETDIRDIVKVGLSSLLVALGGIVTPFILGYFTSLYFFPDAGFNVHLFVGATLCATSVGIKARIFKDLGKLQTTESSILMGAAVIDDIIVVFILAIVTDIVVTGSVGLFPVVRTSIFSILFLSGAVFMGFKLAPFLGYYTIHRKAEGWKLAMAIVFCLLLSYTANLIGLATIVGAFAAGLILREVRFKDLKGGEHGIQEILRPASFVFVPVFFLLIGMQIKLEIFGNLSALKVALVITLAAILGKQVCGLCALEKGLNRIAIGIAMVPRGEVTLIFAGIGKSLGIINDIVFSALIIMVIITTLITPPALRMAMSEKPPIQKD
ncbi:MAG: cation:proton antiporter [Candidatus Scalindua rubra]|uniref:Na+/H+ antiporter n=1 Tax=Candidatus Scalindua brodae TaxID=237368 RepID=A0A0B0ELV5_9BACT|nr:MAG: Na+/H+ antiporter [Candidatus Scalindua brodae]MBZ0107360.1 cation:proton antiporter [Candidatus Scalindua rubra]TWU31443.1 High-affinity Na(+)/H(+) antiporter NhaS3 [Candidatus Brocadiaceae bacterium S225]